MEIFLLHTLNIFFHENVWKKVLDFAKFSIFQKFSWKNNSVIVFPHKNGYANIFMTLFNKIKRWLLVRDRTCALWVNAESFSHSTMGQTGTCLEALGKLSWLMKIFDPCLHLLEFFVCSIGVIFIRINFRVPKNHINPLFGPPCKINITIILV